MLRKILISVFIVLFIPGFLFASDGTTGKLVGKVYDKSTGDPLPALNITIEGTTLGASSDANGNYFINNIPAGTYTVIASYIGYETRTVQNVKVLADHNTTIDFPMVETAIEGEVVIVTAERPLVQQDVTNTVRIQTEEEIINLPSRGTGAVTVLQTGVVDAPGGISIRGGRRNEVMYIVDGFAVNNFYSGSVNLEVNQAAISQLSVTTGGFNAEYGRQMSGAVSIITKTGTRDFHGSIQSISDFIAGDWINTYNYGYEVYDFSLSGSIPLLKNASFFISGEQRFLADQSPRPFIDLLYNPEITDPEDPMYYNNQVLKKGRKTGNDMHQKNWQGKLNYRIAKSVNLEFGILGRKYDSNSFSLGRYKSPEHAYHNKHWNNQAFGKITYTHSSKTFAVLGISHLIENTVSGDRTHWDNWNDYQRGSYNMPDEYTLFYEVHDNPVTTGNEESLATNRWSHTRIGHLTVKGDVTSQVNINHQLQFGFDIQRHSLRYYRHSRMNRILDDFIHWQSSDGSPNIRNIYGYGINYDIDFEVEPDPANEVPGIMKGISNIDYSKGYSGSPPKHPLFMSFYIQDKIEYEGLVVNAGLRYDYYNSDSPVVQDPFNPIDEKGKLVLGDSKINQKISPRLGLGFPVTDKTLLHVNFGKFYQLPNLNDIVIIYDNFEEQARTTSGYYVNNPNLKPETTTAYEAGVTQQIGEHMRLDFTAYYKDISGLIYQGTIWSETGGYITQSNGDFGTIKGFDCGFTLRRYKNISVHVAYSLSYALGTNISTMGYARSLLIGLEPGKQTYPLSFDQRHKLSMVFDYRFPRNGGPTIFGKKLLSSSGINLVVNGGSGFPYTPIKSPYSGIFETAEGSFDSGPLYCSHAPWQLQIDLKANKTFNFYKGLKFDVYVWCLNIMNRINALDVYRNTGSYITNGWLDSPQGIDWLEKFGEEGKRIYTMKMKNSRSYRIPRQLRFGIRFLF